MRADSMDAFGVIAIGTKNLKAGWESVPFEPKPNGLANSTCSRASKRTAVLCAVIVDVIDLQKSKFGLSATIAFRRIAVGREDLKSQFLGVSFIDFGRASGAFCTEAFSLTRRNDAALSTQAGRNLTLAFRAELLKTRRACTLSRRHRNLAEMADACCSFSSGVCFASQSIPFEARETVNSVGNSGYLATASASWHGFLQGDKYDSGTQTLYQSA